MKKITFGLWSLILLGIMSVLPSNVCAQVTEEYDFYTFATGDGYMNAIGDAIAQTGESESKTDVYLVENLKIGDVEMDFNNRFAFNPVATSYQMYWRFRNTGTGFQKGLVGIWNSNKTANPTLNISILDLYDGDEVTITYSIQSGKSAQLHFTKTGIATIDGTEVEADGILESGKTYIIKGEDKNTTVNLDLYGTNNNIGIHKVVITSTKVAETVSKPVISVVGAKNGERTVNIKAGTSTASKEVTTYYTTDGSEPTTGSDYFISESKDIVVGTGLSERTDITIKAISVSESPVSSKVADEIIEAGVVLPLVSPVISVSKMTSTASIYTPTLVASVDNSSIIGSPIAELSASFETESGTTADVTLPYTPSENGVLVVKAEADGYTASESRMDVVATYKLEKETFDLSRVNSSNIADELGSTWEVSSEATRWASWGKNTGVNADGVSNGGDKYYTAKSSDGETMIYDFLKVANGAELLIGYGLGCNNSSTSCWIENPVGNAIAEYITLTSKGANENRVYVADVESSLSVYLSRYGDDILKKAIYYVPVEITTVNVSESGYSTFSSTADVDFSAAGDGLKVYTAKLNDAKDVVTLTEVEDKKVPAGEGVILEGEGEFVGVIITGVAALENNDLIANTEATTVTREDNIYVLNNVEGIGFYPFAGTLTVGKAHLVIDGGSAKVKVVFGGETTGIVNVDNTATGEADVYHTLSGVRVQNPAKGLCIVNGKKVVIK